MKVAFIGNLFHKKTLSSEFFSKILEKYFEMDFYYGLPRTNLKEVDFESIDSKSYDIIIFWQVIPSLEIINKYFRNENLVFIPMFDNSFGYTSEFWLKFKNYKFINFSRNLHEKLDSLNIRSLNVQYAQISCENYIPFDKKEKYKLFFWQRRNEINWNTLKQILDPSQIESIHIHKAIDPDMTFKEPTKDEIEKYNITFSDWFESKEEYINKVKECDIYFVPRLYEGIGMSFIEAMSFGKCIISPNFPTMNEYIKHNENGVLFDIKNPKILDLSKANEIGFNAYTTIDKISREWKNSEKKIIDFILLEKRIEKKYLSDKNEKIKQSLYNLCNISFFKNPIKKYKAYKNMIRIFHEEKNNFIQKEKNRKILIIFPHNPFLLQNGVQTRFYEFIKYLNNKNYIVDILTHINFVDKWNEKDIKNELINKVYFNDFKKSKSQQNLNDSVLPNFAFDSLQQQLHYLQESNNYQILLMSYVHWANIVKDIKNVKKYIMIEDFISMNNYERNKGNYNLGQSINEEIERIELFDKAICISKEEMNFFERACKKVKFYHIPHFLESKFSDTDREIDIVFIGSDNPFNKDGIIWFFEYVMPYLGDIYKIKIIGKINDHLDEYKSKFRNIEFIHYMENLDDIYSKAKISICPLQGGTGLKIKVVESLSFGIPVISTKYGIVGMNSKYNGCIVEDEPLNFAKSIKNILGDNQLYQKYVYESKSYFLENFSKDSVYMELDKIFE